MGKETNRYAFTTCFLVQVSAVFGNVGQPHIVKRMQTYNYHSTQAHCSRLGTMGLMQADYHGPLCSRAFSVLAPQVLHATQDAPAVMIRMDESLTLMEESPPPPGYRLDSPPACIIVRADQYTLWADYAIRLSTFGVRRVVFLDSQMELALLWLERRSTQRAQLLS